MYKTRWILGKSPRYGPRKDLEIQAVEVDMQNPTTYLAEKGFSALVIDWYQDRKVELSSSSF